MKKFLRDLFSDDSHVSMMRFLSLICVLTASSIAIYCVVKGTNVDAASMLCGVFLGVAFTGKVVQKSIESKAVDKD